MPCSNSLTPNFFASVQMLFFLTRTSDMQSLQILDEPDGGDDDDPFTEKLMSFEVY